MSNPEVTRMGALDMQVCITEHYTDEEVKKFADESNPCGTEYGWHIRKEGDSALAGMPERNSCTERKQYVHVMLDA